MVWILVLHISALLLWCATLLYLPLLMAGVAAGRGDIPASHKRMDRVERLVFTHFATPAALAAILSGTLVFVINRTLDGWLIAKLTLVVGLVVCHVLLGLLVLRATSADGAPAGEMPVVRGPVVLPCTLLVAAQTILILAILWTVLAKPS